MKVFVYKNLHKNKWSIRNVDTGRVIGHSDNVWLRNPKFKVSIASRNRVLTEKRKNVHAGVEGELIYADELDYTSFFAVDEFTVLNNNYELLNFPLYYNPYKCESFVNPYLGIAPKQVKEKRGMKYFELDYAVLNLKNEFPVIGYEVI